MSEGAEAGEAGTGGGTSTGGRSAAGTGTAGGAGAVAMGGRGGSAFGGTSGTTSMCTPAVSQGGWTGGDGCPVPWWGTSLAGVEGLLACPSPDNPALLAYGQSNLPPCFELTGPIVEDRSSDGALVCIYHVGTDTCCDAPFVSELRFDIPHFGDGTSSVSLPTIPVEDPAVACARSSGSTVDLSRAETAQRMVGVWLTCEGHRASYFGEGVIFRGDGTFHVIDLDDDRRVSERDGCSKGGLWGLLEEGQLNLYIDDGVQPLPFPRFTAGPEERLMIHTIPLVRATWPAGG